MNSSRPEALLRVISVSLLLLWGFCAPTLSAQTIHVSSTNGDDAFDGSTFSVLGGGVGPKQTLEGALAVATGGETLRVEAGTYTAEGGALTVDTPVRVEIVALSSNTRLRLIGNLSVAANLTIDGDANAFVVEPGGNLNLDAGTLTILTPDDLELPSGVIVTRVDGKIEGNAPRFGSDTFLVYNDDDAGQATVAGLELPSDLGAGTITIDQSSGSIEFPDALTVSGVTVAPETSVEVAFYSSLVSSGDVRRLSGATGDVTFTDVEVGAGNLVNGEPSGTMRVLGTLSFTANKSDEVAKPAVNNAAGGTLSIGDLVFAGVSGPDPGSDHMRLLVNGVGGSVVIRETITSRAAPSTSEASDQVHDVDVAVFTNRGSIEVRGTAMVEHVYNNHPDASVEFRGTTEVNRAVAPGLAPNSINNREGSVTFYTGATLHGALVNPAGQTVTFFGDAAVAGDVNNAGTVVLGPSVTLDLQSDEDFTEIGFVDGANGDLLISGDGRVSAADVPGSMTVSGNGDLGAIVSVGGDLTVSGDGDLTAAHTVGGDLRLAGENDFGPGSAGLSVGGSLNVDGATRVDVGSAADARISVGAVRIGAEAALSLESGNTLQVGGDFDDGNGGAFDASAEGATLHFVLTDDAEYVPGPDHQIAVFRVGGGEEHTLVLRQSLDVLEHFIVDAETKLDVTDRLVRMSRKGGLVDVAGQVIATAVTGALTLKHDEQVLQGGGSIQNIVVNNPAEDPETAMLGSDLTVTNKIYLFDDGLDLNGYTLHFGEQPGTIERNGAGTATEIVDGAGGGAIEGIYHLVYSGALDGDLPIGSEFVAEGVANLSILTSGGAVVVQDPGTWPAGDALLLSGGITLGVDALLRLESGRTVSAAGALSVGVGATVLGGDSLLLVGDHVAHPVAGSVAIDGVLEAAGEGAFFLGLASDGTTRSLGAATLSNLTVSAPDVQVSALHAIEGDLTVQAEGSLVLALEQNSGEDTDNGSVGGSLYAGGSAFTLGNHLRLPGTTGAGDVMHTGGLLDLGTYDLILAADGASFTADSPFPTLEYAADGGYLVVEAQAVLSLGGGELPSVRIEAPASLASDWAVGEDLQIHADLSGDFVTTARGAVYFAEGVGLAGTLRSEGAEVDLAGAATVGGLTVTSPGVTIDGSGSIHVTGMLHHIDGAVMLGGSDLVLDGTLPGADPSFEYEAGTYAGLGTFVFNDDADNSFIPVSTDLLDASIPRVSVLLGGSAAVDDGDGFRIVSGDGITVTELLLLTGGAIDFDTNQAPAFSLGDGATVDRDLGQLLDVPTFGALVNNIYRSAVVTGPELARSGGLLQILDNVVLGAGATPTFQEVDLDARLNASVQDSDAPATLNLASGGTVRVGIEGALTEPYTSSGPVTLVYDAEVRGGTTSNEWPDAVQIARLEVRADIDLGGDHTAQHVIVADGVDVDLAGAHILTATGDVTFEAGAVLSNRTGASNSMGVLAFEGRTPQLFTVPSGGFSPETTAEPTGVTLRINNERGVRLTGGALVMDAVLERMHFVQGALDVRTAGHYVQIYQDATTYDEQGFDQIGGGVWGMVRKEIVNPSMPGLPAVPAHIEFPLTDAEGAAVRNLGLTLDDPNQVASPGRTGIFLEASHSDTAPEGDTGLPIETTDQSGSPLVVTRVPDFHWTLTASAMLPIISYDLELRADDYPDFAAEQIERARALRREGGGDTGWELLGDGPNDYWNAQASPTAPRVVLRNQVGAFGPEPGAVLTFGLESTIAVVDPGPVQIASGQTATLSLDGGVFTGGNPGNTFTYSVQNNLPSIATGTVSGGVLTIRGHSKGAATIQVTAQDAVGRTRSLVIKVYVDFVVGAIEPLVQTVGDTYTLDLTTVVQGGEMPYTYNVTSSDELVAVAGMEGDQLMVTGVGFGTAVISVLVTDADGASLLLTVDVTVSNAITVEQAIPDLIQQVGAPPSTIDLDEVFAGGTGNRTYEVLSDDPDVVAAAVTGSELSLIALVANRSGVPTTVTVIARDDAGHEAELTFDVTPLPLWGDGSVDGEVSLLDATYALEHVVGDVRVQEEPLNALQLTVLDVTGGDITAFDGSRILQHSLGVIDCFNVEPGCPARLEIVGEGELDMEVAEFDSLTGRITVPVRLVGSVRDVYAVQFEIDVDPADVRLISVDADLPFAWIHAYSETDQGEIKLAMAGPTAINDPVTHVTLTFELDDPDGTATFLARGFINENPEQVFGDLTVTSVAPDVLPASFRLLGNYPNPFNPSTTFAFDLPVPATVRLEVYDMLGRSVKAVDFGAIEAGPNRTVRLDAGDLASGTYVYRISAEGSSGMHIEAGTLTLIK